MNRRDMWTRGLTISAFLCAAGAALGQTPPDGNHARKTHSAGAIAGMNIAPVTPEQRAALDRQYQLEDSAAKALDAGQPATAEADAREALSCLGTDSGKGWEILAEALDAQGKDREALQVYGNMTRQGQASAHDLLPYALLLLKAGQWAPAVAAYDKALPDINSDRGLLRANSHFSPDVPEPRALATAIHIALALTQINNGTWGGHMQNDRAMAHLRAALTLSPGSDLANYYYGYGWQQLSPAERAKIGSGQQAKAALRKAVLLGKGDVKKAAQRALKGLKKPA